MCVCDVWMCVCDVQCGVATQAAMLSLYYSGITSFLEMTSPHRVRWSPASHINICQWIVSGIKREDS